MQCNPHATEYTFVWLSTVSVHIYVYTIRGKVYMRYKPTALTSCKVYLPPGVVHPNSLLKGCNGTLTP